MNQNTPANEQAIIEEIRQRMRSRQPGIPADKVRTFMERIGKEIERNDGHLKENVDRLLQQLKNGEL